MSFVIFCSFAGGVEPLCLFLRSRRLIWAFDRHMIGVEPFVPFLKGSCVLVSVVSNRCPCLWGPRYCYGLCGLSHAKWLCSLPLCGFHSLGWDFWPLPSQTISLCSHVVNPLLKGEKFGKSSWYEPWFDGDERLTSALLRAEIGLMAFGFACSSCGLLDSLVVFSLCASFGSESLWLELFSFQVALCLLFVGF